MASNVQLNAGTGGSIAATAQITHDGDIAHLQLIGLMGLAGTEDAYTVANINGDATNGLDVDVTRLIPGTTATALGKAEDQAHASGDTGVAFLAVRRDTPSVGSGADGDYSTVNVSANGYVYTTDENSVDALTALQAIQTAVEGTLAVGSHAVTNAGTFAVQAVQSGAWTVALDTAALTALETITVASVTAPLPAGTNNIGDVDIASALPAGDNNIGNVDVVSSALPTGAATSALQTTGNAVLTTIDADTSALAGCVGGTELQVDIVGGSIGGATHDSAVVAEGVQGILDARSADPTAVATGDAVRAIASLLGKQITLPYAIPAASWSYASPAAVTDTADDAAKAAGAAGVRHYITGVQVFNGHDTVGTEVVIKDGSTVLWRGWAEQTGGGCSARFDPPLRGTAATAVNVANITTGSSTYFNLQGYSAAE